MAGFAGGVYGADGRRRVMTACGSGGTTPETGINPQTLLRRRFLVLLHPLHLDHVVFVIHRNLCLPIPLEHDLPVVIASNIE